VRRDEEIGDRLYGLPPDEFTRARNEAASELRKAGRREEADQVKALRKPTAAAGAVNRLVHEHRSEVEKFLHAAAALRDAQLGGKGDLSAATKREREALDRLLELADGEVRQSLQAAAVDDEAAVELLAGRLERELEPRGFGTLLAHASPRPAEPKPAAPRKPDDRAERARLREATEARSAAAAEEQQARRRWEQTRQDLERAEAGVAAAEKEFDRVRRGG
jgi:hypothetical protein